MSSMKERPMKRKLFGVSEHDDKTDHHASATEKKRRKNVVEVPKHYPKSERQQLALVMQMTSGENNSLEPASPPPVSYRKTPGGSGRKGKIHKRNECGETLLHLCRDLDAMKELVQQGADVNVQDFAGWTPLHEACNLGLQEIARYLLQVGANVNSKGLEDDTPLHDAVTNSHRDLVELLLKNGANPRLKNKRGERPLDIAEDEAIRDLMQNWIGSSEVESGSEHDCPSPSQSEDFVMSQKKQDGGRTSSGSTGSSSGFQDLIERIDETSHKAESFLQSTYDFSYDSNASDDSDAQTNAAHSGGLHLNGFKHMEGKMPSRPASPVLISKRKLKHTEKTDELHQAKPGQTELKLAEVTSASDSSSVSKERAHRKDKNGTLPLIDEFKRHSPVVENGERNCTKPKSLYQYTANDDKSYFFNKNTKQTVSSLKKKVPCEAERGKRSRSSSHDTALRHSKSKTKICRSLGDALGQHSENVAPKANGFRSATDTLSLASHLADGNIYDFSTSTEDFMHSSAINLKQNPGNSSSELFDILCLGKQSKNSHSQIKKQFEQDRSDLVDSKLTLEGSKDMSSSLLPALNSNGYKISTDIGKESVGSVSQNNHHAIRKLEIWNEKLGEKLEKIPANKVSVSATVTGDTKRNWCRLEKKTAQHHSLPTVMQKGLAHLTNKVPFMKSESSVRNESRTVELPDRKHEKLKNSSLDGAECELKSCSYEKLSSGVDLVKKKKKHKHKHTRETPSAEHKHRRRVISVERSQIEKSDWFEKEKSSTSQYKPSAKKADSTKSLHGALSRKSFQEGKAAKSAVLPAAKKKVRSADSISSDANSKGISVTETPKPLVLCTSQEKQSAASASTKKNKPEVKKIALVSDANCAFLSELEKSSKQRLELERKMKLQRKKKLMQQQQRLKAQLAAEAALKEAKLGSSMSEKSQSLLSVKSICESEDVPNSKQPTRSHSLSLDGGNPGCQRVPNFADPFRSDINSADRSEFSSSILKPPPLAARSVLQVCRRLPHAQLPENKEHNYPPTFMAPHESKDALVRRSQSYSEQPLDGRIPPEIYHADHKEITSLHGHGGRRQDHLVSEMQSNNARIPSNILPPPLSANGPMLPTSNNHSFHGHVPVSESVSQDAVVSPHIELSVSCGDVAPAVSGVASIPSPLITKAPVNSVAVAASNEVAAEDETDKGSEEKAEVLVGKDDKAERRENCSDGAESDRENEDPVKEATDLEKAESSVKAEAIKRNLALQSYIEDRLSKLKLVLDETWPKRLPMFLPMEKLRRTAEKDPIRDRLNIYEERSVIRRQTNERRKKRFAAVVVPQAPQRYCDYLTYTGAYLLADRRESWLSIPVLAPPPSLGEEMRALFAEHEKERAKLRLRHVAQREKLIVACEQEVLRVQSRAARMLLNQQVPFSACSIFLDREVYSLEQYVKKVQGESGSKASIRDRFNGRMLLSWLQDVNDKYAKMKRLLLARQRHESQSLHAVQRTEWFLKLQEIEKQSQQQNRWTNSKPEDVSDFYVPLVNVSDDFKLLPG